MDNYKIIEQALIYISENYKKQPHLKSIADYVGLSEYHFQRIFTEWTGISPKKFLNYININNAKKILENNGNIEDATYNIGLSATSRLHDLFVNIYSMTPAEYKNKGKGLKIKYSFNISLFGEYLIASTDKGITNIIFDTSVNALNELKQHWTNAELIKDKDKNHILVKDFIDNKLADGEKISLHLKGTNFQIKVWEALLKIPEGKLNTYSDISKLIDSKAYRAVGSAIGDNPVAYIIPCHRVIRATGEFGNYRWGRNKKLVMIATELDKTNGLRLQA